MYMSKEIKDLIDKERAALFPIILSEYNPEWAVWYEDEKARLLSIIGAENIARISHCGSTAIPNLLAKPTVDILLEVKKDAGIEKILAEFPYPEYNVMRNSAIADKTDMVAVKGYTINGFADRVFHIHIREYGEHPEISFRDYLLKHPETAAEYAKLKKRLIKDFEHDRDGYTNAKGGFIRAILEKAKADNIDK